MSIINESVPSSEVKTDLKVGAAFGDKANEKNTSSFIKGSGPDEVDGIDTAKEAPEELTSDVDSSLKKLKEAKNPFDVLFNKIVSEETFNFSTKEGGGVQPSAFDDSSLNDDEGEDDEYSDEDEDEDEDSDVDEFMDEDEGKVSLTIDKDMAEKLIELLHSAMGEDEGEDEEEQEEDEEEDDDQDQGDNLNFGGAGEDEDNSNDSTYPESYQEGDPKPLNTQKAVNELTNKSSHTVKGVLGKAKKGKAQTPPVGKNAKGGMKSHSTKPAIGKLTKKANQVGGSGTPAKKGKNLFDA